MRFDFPMLLVILTFLTGGIWLLDALLFSRKRKAKSGSTNLKEPLWVEYSRSFFPIILIVLVLRSFILEPFRIPSGSMLPTLLVGDFIVVNKFAYGLRLPVVNTKILDWDEPKRGDVVVFRHPEHKVEYIKRIIGLPGDKISYFQKQLSVNGELIQYTANGTFLEDGYLVDRIQENLEESPHDILLNPRLPSSAPQEWSIPEGHYFVLGDNRDNSNDSRYWGVFSEAHLAGKAYAVWMHWNTSPGSGFPVDWSRIGSLIH